ncbi:hypothetical protein [Amycolatopsis sp. cmx-4-83]|uniref:hypothetical protein n=1 Tax=Amycolatopsis sp. cmx-4-83 TaxID=2790940 RepID=UPI00397B14F0
MSIDYDEAYARSRDVPAFSNGTEGETWMANWCYRCLRDAPHRNMGKGSGCPLILVAMMSRTPAEWLDGPRDEQGRYSMADQYHCIEFKVPGGGGGGEPRPKPDPPGMDGLFPRPERATRMFVQPTPEPARQMAGAS